MSWLGRCTAAIGVALASCGDSGPCSECDEIALEIERAAQVDGIPSEGICNRTEDSPPLPVTTQRAEQYEEACERYARCVGECE